MRSLLKFLGGCLLIIVMMYIWSLAILAFAFVSGWALTLPYLGTFLGAVVALGIAAIPLILIIRLADMIKD